MLEFATSNYGVTFPMFAKLEVNGPDASPLYQWLKEAQPGSGDSPEIGWNFAKFLIDKDGNPVKRYDPQVTPEEIAADLDEYL